MDYEKVFQQLRESMATLAQNQITEAEILSDHGDRIAKLDAEAAKHREATERSFAVIAKYQERTEQNLAEITDKLNGLIGYVDRMQRPPEAPPR